MSYTYNSINNIYLQNNLNINFNHLFVTNLKPKLLKGIKKPTAFIFVNIYLQINCL